ncbi:MAG: DUF4395 domain-containing protein [Solirubrobacterales bacterium]|nr:DUF4395 domain-containing protein [Solirubrobacterales bacterium]
MAKLFSFPDPVNDKAARTVATVVLIEVVLILATGWWWLSLVLAYGFWARVLTGPTLSPIGWLAQNVIAPRFLGEKKYVSGPPKRFAQGMGAFMSTCVVVFGFLLGWHPVGYVFLGMFVLAAGLEAGFGYCLGCKVFGIAMRLGLVPEEVCAECADISGRLGIKSAA